jgi:hypothetical protein
MQAKKQISHIRGFGYFDCWQYALNTGFCGLNTACGSKYMMIALVVC